MKREARVHHLLVAVCLAILGGVSIFIYRINHTDWSDVVIQQQMAVPASMPSNVNVKAVIDPDSSSSAPASDALVASLAGKIAVELNPVPLDDVPLLAHWAARRYINMSVYLSDPSVLEKEIARIPLEIYSEDVTDDDIKAIREAVKKHIQVFSAGTFEDYMALRGGREALATTDASEYTRKVYEGLIKIVSRIDGSRQPSDSIDAMRIMWEHLYAGRGYMDKVSFDGAFIAFHKTKREDFDEEEWEPHVSGLPNALQKEAIKRGSPHQGNDHRVLENKITPRDVVLREGEIRFVDFCIATGSEGKASFPLMFRLYKEPRSGKWLSAFSAVFYNKDVPSGGYRTLLY